MADGVFEAALGRAVQLVDDNPNSLVVLLLKAAEADATLETYANMSLLLAEAGNTEADFTNYARKTGITETIATDTGLVDLDAPDQTWSTAGGASNNTLAKAIVAISTGAGDANLIPISHHDFAVTTDGSDMTLQFNAEGFYRAT